MSKMPVVFLGHGSPMNIVEKNRFTEGWQAIAREIPRPEAILCVSAHWYERGLKASSAASPPTIYDFYGFPSELYQLTYPAPGAPALASELAELFSGELSLDPDRGLDHGAWSVLSLMYPDADIPVCQLSVNASHSPLESYQAGQRLRPLREKGILILGSGNVVHNLALADWERADGYDWADEFDAYIKAAVSEGRPEAAVDYLKAGPSARQAFSHRDHYDPLLYVLGAADEDEPVRVFNDGRLMGSMSMTSYLIG